MKKPFDIEVLLLKIEAILGRKSFRMAKKEPVSMGVFDYFPSKRELVHNDETIKLSPKESALLELFHHHINTVTPRSEALQKIWGTEDYFTTRSMDVYVTKLRKKLSLDSELTIENIHGRGYILHVP